MFEYDCFGHMLFLGVLYASVLYLQLSMFHIERHSRNTLIIISSSIHLHVSGTLSDQQTKTVGILCLKMLDMNSKN